MLSETIIQFIKFASIGVWNTIFDIVLWRVLIKVLPNQIKLHPKIIIPNIAFAQSISFTVASCVSFLLNLYFTFGNRSGVNLQLTFLKFVITTGIFMLFSSFMITKISPYFQNKKLLAKLCVVAITLPLTYFVYKYWVY